MTNTAHDNVADGAISMVPPEKMIPSAKKLRDTYSITPGAPLFHREFGYYCLEQWYQQGLDRKADLADVFGYDPPGNHSLRRLGWTTAEFIPCFEEKLIEDRGDYEFVRDTAGRGVLYFKGRRDGFMPEYLDHPVKDMRTWQQECKWRLDASTPQRWNNFQQNISAAKQAAAQGLMITQCLIGGYMYLRSLIGPGELLYAFYDHPEVIHDCMQTWLKLADAVIARHQEHLTLDELFLAEDICYNHGPLISPEMMKEFLFPYYQQLVSNVKSRQLDKARHLYVQIDTDGFALPVIDLYKKAVGMDAMSPFEVASGCDVVDISKLHPDLVISGGIDKRIMAQDKNAIDRHLEYIIPTMRQRGGYIPTCDHGVPAEVSLDNYLHYRKRVLELDD